MARVRTWRARIVDRSHTTLDPKALTRIAGALAGGMVSPRPDGTLVVTFDIDATTADTAAREAAADWRRTATLHLDGPNVISLHVDDPDTLLNNPADLIDLKTVCDILGVSRQRARELERTHPDFPAPAARIGNALAYNPEAVRRFAAGWDRSPAARPNRTV